MKRKKKSIHLGRMITGIFILGVLVVMITSQIGNHAPISIDQNEVELSPDIITEQKSIYKVVIDVGHGGKDPGATGASGKEEKEYTLALALKLYELLKQEAMFEPHLTRTDDTFIRLEDRATFGNELDADAFLSLHGNTFEDDPEVGGTETYYYSERSFALANALHEHLVDELGFRDRGVRKEEWKVLTVSEVPAVLLEIGYLTNMDEEASMLKEGGQARTAQAIVEGLKQYFGEIR